MSMKQTRSKVIKNINILRMRIFKPWTRNSFHKKIKFPSILMRNIKVQNQFFKKLTTWKWWTNPNRPQSNKIQLGEVKKMR